MRTKQTAENIDEYIAGFPKDVQEILQRVRSTIKEAAPEAEETISYQIPTFNLKGRYLIYFAGYKNHIGVYPAPHGDEELEAEMAAYRSGKGTVKFALDKPIPWNLISKIVKSRAKENLESVEAKRKKKSGNPVV